MCAQRRSSEGEINDRGGGGGVEIVKFAINYFPPLGIWSGEAFLRAYYMYRQQLVYSSTSNHNLSRRI